MNRRAHNLGKVKAQAARATCLSVPSAPGVMQLESTDFAMCRESRRDVDVMVVQCWHIVPRLDADWGSSSE